MHLQKPKVLIGGLAAARHGKFRDMLSKFELIDLHHSECIDANKLVKNLQGVSAFIAGGEALTRDVLDACSELRVIARLGSGYDTIDMNAAVSKNVVVTVCPGVNARSVAEHALALLLASSRRIVANDRGMRLGMLARNGVQSVSGATLGIVGFGHVGRELARIVESLEMRVLVTTRNPGKHNLPGISFVDLDDLLANSDFICLCVPLTSDTVNLIDERAFSLMQHHTTLINVSRGKVIDEIALIEALRTRTIKAAALDVFQCEPLPLGHDLYEIDNVILSPHVAGLDEPTNDRVCIHAANTIAKLASGAWIPDQIVWADQYFNWRW